LEIIEQKFAVYSLHRVPKKHVTTISTITLTVSVRFQQFLA